MTSHALRPSPRRIRRRPLLHDHRRKPVAVEGELLSVAGVVGSTVYDGAGFRIGTLHDLVSAGIPASRIRRCGAQSARASAVAAAEEEVGDAAGG